MSGQYKKKFYLQEYKFKKIKKEKESWQEYNI